MKKDKLIILLLCSGFVSSCSLVHRLEKYSPTVSISLPATLKNDSMVRNNLPEALEYLDNNGKKQIVIGAVKDSVTGQEELSVDLNEITVIAKSKTVPERKGKVSIDFIVSVPESLIDKNWQLTLTPNLLRNQNRIVLDDIVVSGSGFYSKQQKGYKKYADYLSRITPESMFYDKFVDTRSYAAALDKYQSKENKRIRKDSLLWVRYAAYSSGRIARYKVFNDKMQRSRLWLGRVLGFDDIKRRYEVFGHDTFRISNFYSSRFEAWERLIPQFHLFRDLTGQVTPARYRYEGFKQPFVRDYHHLSTGDSLLILQKYYRTKLIGRNERLMADTARKYRELVVFPRNPYAKLDTVITRKGMFEYHYCEELDTDEDSKRMQLYLTGSALSKNGKSYLLANSDTLSYVVSSMIQFLDLAPRFQRKIIERKAVSSLKAYITFPSGKSHLDKNLADNRKELDKIGDMIGKLSAGSEFVMDSIVLWAKSSPEGSYTSNRVLSQLRGQAIGKYFREQLQEIGGIDTLLVIHALGEGWNGLSGLLRTSKGIGDKDKIMGIITSAIHPDVRETRIRQLFPAAYQKIRKEIYPLLRAVDFTFHLHRAGMVKDTIHTTVPDTLYARAIEMMKERKYNRALTILGEYNDYNTAVCLMSLGYNEGAYAILIKEPCTADSQYLLSILAARLGREKEAVQRYLHACSLDESKRWRGALDPEINRLIKAYSLNKDSDE